MEVFGEEKKYARDCASFKTAVRLILHLSISSRLVLLRYTSLTYIALALNFVCIICGRRWVNFCEYLGLDDWDKSERKRLTEKTKLCKISIYLRKCFLSLPERASGLYVSIFVFIAD